MGFANLWGALFGLTVPAIILLWLLKRKRVDQVVSSTYLWDQVLKDTRANAPWQRLRHSLLMLLQVAAALLLTLALTRPFLAGALGERAHLVLILDISGSMQATHNGESRFAAAVAGAQAVIQGARPDDLFTVIAAGPVPRLLTDGPTDGRRALAALTSLAPTNGRADLSQALSLAGSFGTDDQFTAILFTDGAPAVPEVDFPLQLVTVGEPMRNLAVERLVVQGALALARVVNHGQANESFTLELYGLDGGRDRTPVGSRTGVVAAGQAVDLVLTDLPLFFRGFEARLTGPPDDLAADDVAVAVTASAASTRVLLVSGGNLYLEKALALREGLHVVKATPAQYSPGDYSLYIFDGWLPETLPPGAIWAIHPPEGAALGGWSVGGEVVEAVGELRPGPTPGALLHHMTLADVRIARARAFTPPPWADVVIESGAGPLLFTGRLENRPVAVLGFDLHESNLPLRLAFPVLVHNLISWLSPSQAVPADIRAGEQVALALDPVAAEAYVVTPSGRRLNLAPPLPAPPLTETDEIGLYRLIQVKAGKEEETLFAVNFPLEESADQSEPISARQTASAQAMPRRSNRELWPWLSALALAIISLEWWVYTRGR